jgi:hypothetical protein
MIIDAKNKFREGFIMLNRPFQFTEMKNPIQKLTIVYAYAEQAKFENRLTIDALKKIDEISNESSLMNKNKFINESHEDYVERQLTKIYESPSNIEKVYKGEIVQCIIDGQTCRFYPDEYSLISQEKLNEIMIEEGYHAIVTNGLEKIKAYQDVLHYLKSRGVGDVVAKKWAGLTFKDLIYFKPYYELLDMFCRDYEIYPDEFYREVEGVVFDETKDNQRKQPPSWLNK